MQTQFTAAIGMVLSSSSSLYILQGFEAVSMMTLETLTEPDPSRLQPRAVVIGHDAHGVGGILDQAGDHSPHRLQAALNGVGPDVARPSQLGCPQRDGVVEGLSLHTTPGGLSEDTEFIFMMCCTFVSGVLVHSYNHNCTREQPWTVLLVYQASY